MKIVPYTNQVEISICKVFNFYETIGENDYDRKAYMEDYMSISPW